MSSKYNHNKYETFKHIKAGKMKGRARGFLNSVDNEYIVNKDLLLIKLINYYSDLNQNLKRVSNNIHDHMFMRFAHYIGVFRSLAYFNFMTEHWDDLFSLALEEWFEEHHYKFNETYKLSFVAYFDMKFSAIMSKLFFNIVKNKFIERKFIPFSQIDNYELVEAPNCYLIDVLAEYPRCLVQELVSQSFAPSLLTKS